MARFNETVNIRQVQSGVTDIGGANTLASRLSQFSSQQAQRSQANQARKAQIAVGEGQAQFDPTQELGAQEREVSTFFGQEAQAFNKGLRAAYVAGIDRDIRENVSRIQAENPDNIQGFNDSANEYIGSTLNEMDQAARPLIEERALNLLSSARTDVQAATIGRHREEADNESILAIERAAQDAMRFTNQGKALEGAESLLTAFAVIDERVDSGMLDPSAAVEQKRKLELGATVENIRHSLDVTIAENGIISAIDVINLAEDNPLKGFNVSEQDALVKTLKADLNQFISLQNITEREQQDSLKIRQEAASTSLYLDILNGQADAADVMFSASQKQISGAQLSKLTAVLQTRGQGIDDFGLIRDIQSLMDTNPGVARRMIEDNTGSRLTEKSANDLMLTTLESENKDSPLQTSRAKRFRSFLTNSVKVVGPLGAIDFESQKRLADLTIVYQERVLAGDDPADAARDLVDVNAFLTAPNPRTGTKDDLQGALKALNEQFDSGTVEDSQYDRQIQLIDDLMEQKSNIDAFERALKEALKE